MIGRYRSTTTDFGYLDSEQPCVVAGMAAPAPFSASANASLDAGAIVASLGEVAYEWHIDTDALTWGRNAAEVFGVGDVAVIATGRGFAQFLEPQGGRLRVDAVLRSSASDEGTGVRFEAQYAFRAPGRPGVSWIEDSGRWFAGPDGKPQRVHGIVRIINERHEREERLTHRAHCDPLTGDFNRWRMAEILAASIEDALKQRSSCGFLLVAIDNLNSINQSYGYDIGDQVIAGVSTRIRAHMRAKDHLGRFSGNKFGIVLINCTPDDLLVAADRLIDGVRDKVVATSAGPVAVTITVGGITTPRYARNVAEVLTRAQDALDQAKAKRRGSFQAYRPNLERETMRRENVRATDEIITALNDRRIFLVHEPVVAIGSRQPVFYECLMRVRRADGSLVTVSELVPLAERLGLVRLLDHRVLELVLEELAASPELCASVNVSAASTIDPDWWGALGAMLRGHSGVAERLIVEITETTAIADIDETRGFVARVKDLGCRIAIDDFGAGYTSFRNLRKLGVDLVKIDGAFVQNLRRSEDDRAFVQTLIDLARRLSLQTVAEWVQDEETAVILSAWGCDLIQGALVGLASTQRPWLDARLGGRGSSPTSATA
jgi:diguanylate cyclase (GGDEF)-like protein